MSFLIRLWALSPKMKTAILLLIVLFAIGGLIGYLWHEAKKAESEKQAAEKESERLRKQTEGLRILTNTANAAIEVENEKRTANLQAINSNLANANYADTRRRDSSQSSGNFAEARARFCAEFPDDSRCR